MDNARHHSSSLTQESRPEGYFSCSPITLFSRFKPLFRAIKQDLKNDDFGGPEAVVKAIQRSIRQIPENTLLYQLKKLRDHCHPVIGVSGVIGDYVSRIH